MMKKAMSLAGVAFCLLLNSWTVSANESSPEMTIEHTLENLFEQFTLQRSELEQNNRKLFELVEELVVPVFDLERIAKLVLSKNWKNASEAQRKEFEVEFKRQLIGTYATALFKYTGDEKIEFDSTDITEKRGFFFATVNSKVYLGEGGALAIPVDYSMIQGEDGDWKIYNLSIDGLNMITTYRTTYGNEIRSKGLDGLLESMKISNDKNYS